MLVIKEGLIGNWINHKVISYLLQKHKCQNDSNSLNVYLGLAILAPKLDAIAPSVMIIAFTIQKSKGFHLMYIWITLGRVACDKTLERNQSLTPGKKASWCFFYRSTYRILYNNSWRLCDTTDTKRTVSENLREQTRWKCKAKRVWV